jgi:hypothetical protein
MIILCDDDLSIIATYQIYRLAATDNLGESYFLDTVIRRAPGEVISDALSYEVAQPQLSYHPEPAFVYNDASSALGYLGPHYEIILPDPTFIPTRNRGSLFTYTFPIYP